MGMMMVVNGTRKSGSGMRKLIMQFKWKGRYENCGTTEVERKGI